MIAKRGSTVVGDIDPAAFADPGKIDPLRKADEWAQFRYGLQTSFGAKLVGSALAAVSDVHVLRDAYARWPLFTAMINNVEMSLAKTDDRSLDPDAMLDRIDEVCAWTTWAEIRTVVASQLNQFHEVAPSIRGTIERLAHSLSSSIDRHVRGV